MHNPTAASPNTNATNMKIQRPNIKHIVVVVGGDTTGFMTFGALKFLHFYKIWNEFIFIPIRFTS